MKRIAREAVTLTGDLAKKETNVSILKHAGRQRQRAGRGVSVALLDLGLIAGDGLQVCLLIG